MIIMSLRINTIYIVNLENWLILLKNSCKKYYKSFFDLVEMVGVEPTSEKVFISLSPNTVNFYLPNNL